MTKETDLGERICRVAASLHRRGLTQGSTGSILPGLDDGRIIVSPTGPSFDFLDPARIPFHDSGARHTACDAPIKTAPLPSGVCAARKGAADAVDAAADIDRAGYALVELETAARLAVGSHGGMVRGVSDTHIAALCARSTRRNDGNRIE